jgi:hypothetical protein
MILLAPTNVWSYLARVRLCPHSHAMPAQEVLCGAQDVSDL